MPWLILWGNALSDASGASVSLTTEDLLRSAKLTPKFTNTSPPLHNLTPKQISLNCNQVHWMERRQSVSSLVVHWTLVQFTEIENERGKVALDMLSVSRGQGYPKKCKLGAPLWGREWTQSSGLSTGRRKSYRTDVTTKWDSVNHK